MAPPTRPARTFPPRRAGRPGYTLVFFAMMLAGILALAALVIDIGFARLTQRQMQVAADSAAVEGLRGEGALPYADRRAAARNFVHWHFDDDLDSTAAYPADDVGAFGTGSGPFGAGPRVEFSGGVGDPALAAGQLLEVEPGAPVHRPVALDGTPSAAGSFQVALRRGPADAPAADLYSDGPALPYLFARGSLLNRRLVADGINVRGTGRALAAPALSVGLPDEATTPPLPGLAPLALELRYWNGLTTGTADVRSIAAGEIVGAGSFFAWGPADALPLTIGRPLAAAAVPTDGSYGGYVPIYADLSAAAVRRVVGFGSVQVVVSGGGTVAAVTRLASRVGAENVSPVRCYPGALPAAEAAEVWALVREVAEPLLAPSSRSVGP